jgi:hypothetical protein
MTDAPAIAEAEDPACAHDLARGLIESQLAMLNELAEIGMTLARRLGREVETPAPQDAKAADPTLAFDRVARAVRHSLALQSKLVADLKALEEGRVPARPNAAGARKQAVQHIIANVVRTVTVGSANQSSRIERFRPEIDERLDDDVLYGDLMTRPLSELVADICRDLGLDPDWSSLATEHWAQAEIAGGHVGWPLKDLGNPPPPGPVARPPPHADPFGAAQAQERAVAIAQHLLAEPSRA